MVFGHWYWRVCYRWILRGSLYVVMVRLILNIAIIVDGVASSDALKNHGRFLGILPVS